jgi:hypothetical protein
MSCDALTQGENMPIKSAAAKAFEDDKSRINWISVQGCAELYGVNPKTIRRWIALGLVEARRFGPKLIRVDAASVERMATPLAG